MHSADHDPVLSDPFPYIFMKSRLLISLTRSLATLSLGLFSIAGVLHAQQPGESPVKIFILAGQSNMEGQGEILSETTPGSLEFTVANDPAGDYQYLVDGVGDWVERDDVWIRDESPAQGELTVGWGANTSLVGPELAFGHFIGDLNEQQVLIVKAAWGGKSLAVDFRPPSSGWSGGPPVGDGDEGFYYTEILRLVNEATSNLGTYFPDYDGGGFEIAGFAWHQGWNDRVDAGRSAEYETNMANFINDIRSVSNGLGIPDLPFVIATTGMDGGPNYTVVEQAQLAMANPGSYPAFAGNVAVIDTRFPYEGLEFWQAAQDSPADQGFHWNRNAKTYLHIGEAMADAMSTLAPGRCPFRIRAEGAPSGVALSWENGTETPTSVRILRDGVEIAAAASADPPSYLDSGALPGAYDYELQFTMPGDPCDPLTVSFDGAITDLTITPGPGGLTLDWTNNMGYAAIEIRRDGVLLEAALSGTATTYTDVSPPSSGIVNYTVAPTTGTSTPASVDINLNLAGELGVLDPYAANGGINPATGLPWAAGDTYRLVFVSGASITATSTDIATYNTFVQFLADLSGLGGSSLGPVSWKAVGSTASIDARDNLDANPSTDGAGEPILLMDGTTVIADGYADLWNGIEVTLVGAGPPSGSGVPTGDPSVDHARGIYLDETGADQGNDDRVFTGTNANGTASGQPLGTVGNVSTGSMGSGFPASAWGLSGTESTRWTQDFSFDGSQQQEMYGMSGVLTIIDTTPDTTPPTLLSIDDDASGADVFAGAPVSYTVTFDEAMDAATVETDDFDNAANAPITVDSVSATANPAVFTVVVTATAPGDLQLQIAAGAVLQDPAGNTLDVGSASPDDTTITIVAPPPLLGQLGVLDTDGINPTTGVPWAAGDTYRLIFVTSTTTDATSTDISTYNAFVQGVADAAGLGTSSAGSVTWSAVGSTATVDARDNTGTAGAGGSPILLMDGTTIIADDNADLWDGIVATIVGAGPPSGTGPLTGDLTVDHARGIYITESGTLLNPPPQGADDRVFTGTIGNGTASGQPLGAVGNVSTGSTGSGFGAQYWGVGGSGQSTRWTEDFNFDGTQQQQMYAISGTLTVQSTSTNTYADYIAGFPGVGSETEFEDDPDGDRIPNGLEAWFGTSPEDFTTALSGFTSDGTVSTFSHSQNEAPPSDVVGSYEWSLDLSEWFASGDGPVGGPTVSFGAVTTGPTTAVTATSSQALERIFVRVRAVQN